jgi:hypothetical protein
MREWDFVRKSFSLGVSGYLHGFENEFESQKTRKESETAGRRKTSLSLFPFLVFVMSPAR